LDSVNVPRRARIVSPDSLASLKEGGYNSPFPAVKIARSEIGMESAPTRRYDPRLFSLAVSRLPELPMTPFLPTDWKDVLRRVDSWLTQTAESAAQRERAFEERFRGAGIPACQPESKEDSLPPLAAKMTPLKSLADEAEVAAVLEETALRERVQRSESLRLKLAERVGRAIG
jgi:hypothetical protein